MSSDGRGGCGCLSLVVCICCCCLFVRCLLAHDVRVACRARDVFFKDIILDLW